MNIDKDLTKLEFNFKIKVIKFLADKRIKDLGVLITEGFRTPERQQYLFNSGRTNNGPILTWLNWGSHNEGIAIDIACSKGQLYPNDLQWWKKVYKIAKEYEIYSLYEEEGVDKPHLQSVKKYIPNKIYKDNQKDMENLKEEFYKNQLETVLLANSNLWKVSDNPQLKEKLSEMNNYLRELLN